VTINHPDSPERKMFDGLVPNSPRVLDLFSGCGGMSWGLHKAGFQIVGAIDDWGAALRTFRLNHPDAKIFEGDIRAMSTSDICEKLSLRRGELEVLVGGPPCQGFSKNTPASERFLLDPRNQLFREFMRFVEDLYPKVVIMENVAEIFNAFDGAVRREVISMFTKLGYKIDVKILNAFDFGVPQKRRRCFFLASRVSWEPEFPSHEKFPRNQMGIGAWGAISDLPEPSDNPTSSVSHINRTTNEFQRWVRGRSRAVHNHYDHPLQPKQRERYASIKAGEGLKDLPDRLRPKSGYSGAYGRLDFVNPAPTITRWVFHPGSGRFGHPSVPRIITMREAARLQSFTDDFIFAGTRNEIAGQIGNAVPPLLMFRVGETLKAAFANQG
jgi:DNA (cytosine-5)-methyltransferase 1